jgi:CIC family chloride channel protein
MAESKVVVARTISPIMFGLLSVVIGIVAGLGAVVFRGMIAVFHNLLFLQKFSFTYDANVHTSPSPLGPWIIAVPVVGAVGVAFLVKNFAPEAKGHGVPEVMDASYYSKGIIRPIVAVIKSVASALSIGSGGSIGREGPIIQIGASFGSTLGQWLRLSVWQRIAMIAAGAGGGIAATFNTPLGGILFAVEIMLQELSVRTIVPVIISTVTATYIGRLVFGDHPSFIIPHFEAFSAHTTNPEMFVAYVVLGILLGLVSALFIRSIYAFEDFFEEKVPGNYYSRHMSGMLIVGIMMYLMMTFFGHYYIEGVGYATVQDVLTGRLTLIGLLLLLFVLKLLSTSLTLGSGASGGIFSPSLFMGATLGGAYGIGLGWIFPSMAAHAPAFAVAGMAGVVGGATGAAMAAVIMIFEMTSDYQVAIPMAITVAVAYLVRKLIMTESIYTLKLVRRGHYMPDALQSNYIYLKRARDLMQKRFSAVAATQTVEGCGPAASSEHGIDRFLVSNQHGIIGTVTPVAVLDALRRGRSGDRMGDLARQDHVIVAEAKKFYEVIDAMKATGASVALVASHDDSARAEEVVGIITKEHMADAIAGALEFYSD